MTSKKPQIIFQHEKCRQARVASGGVSGNKLIMSGCGRSTVEWMSDETPEHSERSIGLHKATKLADQLGANAAELTTPELLSDFTNRYGPKLRLIQSTVFDDSGPGQGSWTPRLLFPPALENLRENWRQMSLLLDQHAEDLPSCLIDQSELRHNVQFLNEVEDELAGSRDKILHLQALARNPTHYRHIEQSRKQSDSVEDLWDRAESERTTLPDDLALGGTTQIYFDRRVAATAIQFIFKTEEEDYDYDRGSPIRQERITKYSFPSVPVVYDVYVFAPIETKCLLLHTPKFPHLSYEFFSEFHLDGSPGPHGFTWACKKGGRTYRLSDSDLKSLEPYRDDDS